MFLSDIICDFNLHKLINHHKNSGAEGTIYVTESEDPSKCGVVIID